ncbi:hypothetical protein DFQ11_101957 [Winogradskyella epiphytica]|uniref:Heme-binding HmuY-like protein n=1 Tax=Winogradskyella epiphytica TaxID=262005 RepID=A0A2V4XJM1_9FLAO|nr:hypothetical protein [Winogradskyella epiphytica]PYE83520.1 hypothetical protein DFQ11_101957 [Winogradskyella epiphytica]GGW58756.1 hypothetical protein GCM10008085_08130 [Winogradskyella epiphytica]
MKNKKITYLSALFTIALFTMSSCDNDHDPTNNLCDDTYVSTAITDAFSIANGYDDLPETMDLETHKYQIKINADGEICSVGYQNPSTWTGNYLIDIVNETSNASYSGIHSFSQTQLDYQSISPIAVSSGDIITVMRTIQNSSSLNETVGRILRKSDYTNTPYPINYGTVEFLSSDFYGSGGPVPNFGQPYIPLGFKVN